MPIDSVGDPFAEISSEVSGLCTMKECVWLLCRMRHSSHNVEFRTMPHRVLRTLLSLPSTLFCSA